MIRNRLWQRSKLLCDRQFSITVALRSGHNRWSKIKHDKAKEDASVTRQRSALAAELRQASKEYGPDPQLNSRLADIVTKAKKLGFPKASIDNAIARGQGVSPSGATLDTVTIEAMLPSSVAVIVECQTDSKLRTLADIRQILKDNGGIATPTSHLFERKGKVVLEKTSSAGETEVFDRAVEAGAVDVDHDEEGNIVITTEPNETSVVGNALAQSLGNKVRSSEVIWKPKEEVMVNLTSSESLNNFLDYIHGDASVQDVYTNSRPVVAQ